MMRTWVGLLLALGVSGAAMAQTPPPGPAVPPAAGAAAVAPAANPYSATVPVAGTSDAQRSAAIAAALTVVLQGISPGFSPDAGMLANAAGYVRDYRYRRAASGVGLELQVDFDPAAVGRMLARPGGGGAATAAAAAPAAASSASAAVPGSGTAPSQAVASSGTGTLWVGGIDSSHAFASVLALLRGDPQLKNVVPVAASGAGVMLQVDYSQPLAAVVAALATPNGHLTPSPQPHPGADAALQWTP
ncbi:MAG: DUF2066 domain-containing protein [Rhodanobacteraceae bacterium]|nr:MAG: DUF2066 domain-containing protein [Rhodanobacteraceae bacterium]